jgi:hypothetical protein
MKLRFTVRPFQLRWLILLTFFGLALAACTGIRSTVATAAPAARLTLTAASAPGLPLTQTAARVPTRYLTATPSPRPPTATAYPPGYPLQGQSL